MQKQQALKVAKRDQSLTLIAQSDDAVVNADAIAKLYSVDPQLAHEALQILKDEAVSRRAREDRHLENRHNENKTALWLPFVIVMTDIVGAIFLAMNAHENVAIAMLSIPVFGVVAGFVKNVFKRN